MKNPFDFFIDKLGNVVLSLIAGLIVLIIIASLVTILVLLVAMIRLFV